MIKQKEERFKKVVEYNENVNFGGILISSILFGVTGVIAITDKTIGWELINSFFAGCSFTLSLVGILSVISEIVNARKVTWRKI